MRYQQSIYNTGDITGLNNAYILKREYYGLDLRIRLFYTLSYVQGRKYKQSPMCMQARPSEGMGSAALEDGCDNGTMKNGFFFQLIGFHKP